MTTSPTPRSRRDSDAPFPDYEQEPLSRAEYISALSHLYRGEMQRALEWRSRLDTTSNWAIIATLGILTFSFNNPLYSQETIIAGMYANLVFLLMEGRRFRFFDVWRARVRMIEENFYGPILRRDLKSPIDHWGAQVAEDLLHPKFKIQRRQALRARFLRNYIYVFGFLLVAWLGRHYAVGLPWDGGLDGMFGIGEIPGWLPILMVGALYLGLFVLVVFTPRIEAAELGYWQDPARSGKAIPTVDV